MAISKEVIIDILKEKIKNNDLGANTIISYTEDVINKKTPFGEFDTTQKVFPWNDLLIENNTEPGNKWHDFTGESDWIGGIMYEPEMGILTWYFNPISTNNKPEIIQGIVGGGVPESFYNSILDAPSKGTFYLEFVALYKRLPNGMIKENPHSMFKPIDINDVVDFDDDDSSNNNLPQRLVSTITSISKHSSNLLNNPKYISKAISSYLKGKLKRLAKKTGKEVYSNILNDKTSLKRIDIISKNAYQKVRKANATNKQLKKIKINNSEAIKKISDIKNFGKTGGVNVSTYKMRKVSSKGIMKGASKFAGGIGIAISLIESFKEKHSTIEKINMHTNRAKHNSYEDFVKMKNTANSDLIKDIKNITKITKNTKSSLKSISSSIKKFKDL